MNTEELQLVTELLKPTRRNVKRRYDDICGINETWQVDIVEMLPYEKENKSYKYLLTIIDIFSKFPWALPVKSKTGDVTSAMKSVLARRRVPKNVQVDRGKECYNQFNVVYLYWHWVIIFH